MNKQAFDYVQLLYHSYNFIVFQKLKNHHEILYHHLAKKLDLSLTGMQNGFFDRYNPYQF